MRGHNDGIKSVRMLPNDCLASGSCDKNIIIWNLLTGQMTQLLTGHDGWVDFCIYFLRRKFCVEFFIFFLESFQYLYNSGHSQIVIIT